jgi:hypothetical protein
MESVRQFLLQYKSIPRKKLQYDWHNNVHDNVEYSLKVMEFIEKNMEMLEESVESYLKMGRSSSYFLKDWLQYGMNVLSAHLRGHKDKLPDDVAETWKLFFDEDFPTFEGLTISFQATKRLVKERNDMCSLYNCDDKDILEIHANKKCDCWYMCSLCEEQEYAWKKIIEKRFSFSNNIFMDKSSQDAFIEKWVLKHSINDIHKWPPTKVYYEASHYQSRYMLNEKKEIHDFAEMCALIKKDRKKYKEIQGQTPIQCYESMSHDIQQFFNSIQVSDSDFTIFMKLWNQLELVPIWLAYDKARCKEILEML